MNTLTLRPKVFKPLNKMNQLSANELRCLENLRTVTNRGPWGEIVRSVVMAETLDVKEFRNLVCELLSQSHDDSEVMKSILGAKAFESLMNLK